MPTPVTVGLFRAESNLGTYITDEHRHRVVNVWYTLLLTRKPSKKRDLTRWDAENLVAAFTYARQSPPKYMLILLELAADPETRIIRAEGDANGDGMVDLFDRWSKIGARAFNSMLDAERLDPFLMVGSFAGAFADGQFLPITVLTAGVDGDGDGRIDLYGSIADMSASTNEFLWQAGWRSEPPNEAAKARRTRETRNQRALARYLGSPRQKPYLREYNYTHQVWTFAEKLADTCNAF